MKLKKEEIQSILSKAIESAVGAPVMDADKEADRLGKIEKSIAAVTAQMSSLAELAATGFEKPKTVEEQIADMGKSLKDEIIKAMGSKKKKKLKKDTDKDEDDKDKDEDGDDKDEDGDDKDKDEDGDDKDEDGDDKDKDEDGEPASGDIQKMIQKEILKAFGKITKKSKVKGKGKDKLKKDTDDEDSDDLVIDGIKITEDLHKETHDAAGNELSKEKIISRAKLDNYFGKTIAKQSEIGADEEIEIDIED